ncbi:MAG: NAD-dependent epimerase/dehydratase family protein [Terrimicrobiaceae bacterium]|nr:NAD-dependent epimerase/dehydratase family protein [Terrimicrobiaceae bacterium]
MMFRFSPKSGHAVITGGAGFVGANLADELLRRGETVVLLDNLSRPGVDRNLRWLSSRHENVRHVRGDVRNAEAVRDVVQGASSVFHFAAQVAVTTSLEDPALDFAVNAQGTLNVLEAVRTTNPHIPVLYTSTNKVYGCLDEIPLRKDENGYVPVDSRLRSLGIDESRPVSFLSPYGCSKGAADQYVLDYARSFGLAAVVFRMSCIYGPRQMGTEDQGWVAHFLRSVLENERVAIYGDGLQVRDLLFVSDLVDAFLLARESAGPLAGQAFNIGGGPAQALSVGAVLRMIGEIEGTEPITERGEWRMGDQRYYVTNFAGFRTATGWSPVIGVSEGLRRLHTWLRRARPRVQGTLVA